MSVQTTPIARSDSQTLAATLVSHGISLTCVEFIYDYPMQADGNNLTNTAPDHEQYASRHMMPRNFGGWGRGVELTGCDWSGRDNHRRPACFWRRQRITMRVRLECDVPPASFELVVQAFLNSRGHSLGEVRVNVTWDAAQRVITVEPITLASPLPNEVARHELILDWFVCIPAGARLESLAQSSHRIYSIYADPLNPSVSSATGARLNPVVGLTKQRLDQITRIAGGGDHRYEITTPEPLSVARLVWNVHAAVNDESPPEFTGGTGTTILYPDFSNHRGQGAVDIDEIDQWVMWLRATWNMGSCIAHVQLMKTMLDSIGIDTRLSWLIPKTNWMPDGTYIPLTAHSLLAVDSPPQLVINTSQVRNNNSGLQEQGCAFSLTQAQIAQLQAGAAPRATTGFAYDSGQVNLLAAVRLIARPIANGQPDYENFEGCLSFGGRLFPGAITTSDYPAENREQRIGFPDAFEVLWWWHNRRQHGFRRFMAWVGRLPDNREVFFDVDGRAYLDPYLIPLSQQLPPAAFPAPATP